MKKTPELQELLDAVRELSNHIAFHGTVEVVRLQQLFRNMSGDHLKSLVLAVDKASDAAMKVQKQYK